MANGGSTNAIIHLVAMAGRAGVDFPLERFNAISARTPVLANVRPVGQNYLMEDFHYAGGLPALLSLLVIMVAAVWQAWKRPDIAGRYALAATLIALIASSVNSAMRDAQIGLALLFISMVYLRLAQERQDPDPWRGLWPQRLPNPSETP